MLASDLLLERDVSAALTSPQYSTYMSHLKPDPIPISPSPCDNLVRANPYRDRREKTPSNRSKLTPPKPAASPSAWETNADGSWRCDRRYAD
eukprot:8629948-Heterocapsa_arctica.AAC.1